MSPKITQVDSFMILNVLIYFYSIQIRWGFHLLHIAMQFIITFITIPGTEYRVDPRWRIRRPFPISSGCRTRAASTPIVWAASLINRTDCSTVFVLAATKSWATSDLRSVLDARSDENESILTLKCLQKNKFRIKESGIDQAQCQSDANSPTYWFVAHQINRNEFKSVFLCLIGEMEPTVRMYGFDIKMTIKPNMYWIIE